jgi:rare lipoprotein A
MVSLGLALACSGCKKSSSTETSAPEVEAPAEEINSSPKADRPEEKKTNSVEGYAVWYDVPPNSLPKRRAGKDELTAAHRRWPLGTMVRVTHLKNGKSVIVRITDRLITKKQHAVIDLCREAAEKLEMISEGRARVQLEILSDDSAPVAATESTLIGARP